MLFKCDDYDLWQMKSVGQNYENKNQFIYIKKNSGGVFVANQHMYDTTMNLQQIRWFVWLYV